MSFQRFFVAITVLFVVAVLAASICYGECVCGETHELTVTIIGTSTLVDVTYDDDNGEVASYTYCISASASCDAPVANAEMVAGDPSWSVAPSDKSTGLDTYSPQWGHIVEYAAPGDYEVELTASVSVSVVETKSDGTTVTHTYTGEATETITVTVGGSVTPQPCPDTCDYEQCLECLGLTCPAPTTMSSNAAL
ncbi:MAG: hypothetical protein LBU65_05270, partial [Planctomycetaceae bacterium]|nr:hypothetical protein [Planctomycetaceae bacterium]